MGNQRDIYHQCLAVIPVCLLEFAMALACGWLGPMIRIFLEDPNSEIKATEEECSWIASMPGIGKTFGPVFSILLLDVLGRKIMIQITATIFAASWLPVLFTRSVSILCVSFFFFGLGIGISNGVTAVYLGENCSPKIRGIFCSASVTSFYLAVLLQYTIAAYLSYSAIATVNFILASCGLISCTFLAVETAQFLMLKGRFEKAESNMMWLRGTKNKDDINTDFENIKANVASEKLKKASYRELFFAPANFKSLIIVLTLNMAHAATGNAALFTYISVLFPQNDHFTSNQVTVYFGISQMTFCLLGSFVIENVNRRSLTLFAFSLFLVCHSISTYFFYDAANNESPSKYGLWIIFAMVCLFSGFSAVLDSVVHMIRGELFPQSIRPIGAGFSIATNSLTHFFTIKIFLMVKSQYGIYMNFLGYAVCSVASFWFTYFFLPETRGKTLIEIQKSLEKQK
ncbi:facilitated trehalose transporter Tret1-like [Planococcus citri]|uniref:facilitated trehalose transporter Tret1-like n=1 Tax=Planococcus citri TaxID=170843 RepID=UPI0031F89F95